MRKVFIVWGILASFSGGSGAYASDLKCPSKAHRLDGAIRAYEEKRAYDSLIQLINPHVKILSRSIYTYNYMRGTDSRFGPSIFEIAKAGSGIPTAEDPNIMDLLKQRVDTFWTDLTGKYKTATEVGGLWVADEPFSSRYPFGGEGEEWVLSRIELPNGHRFLDLRTTEKDFDNESLVAGLKVLECDEDWLTPYKLFRGNSKKHSLVCQQVAQSILKRLNVDSIFYEWGGGDFKSSKKYAHAAMILIKSDYFLPSNVRVFTSKVSNELDPDYDERLAIMKLSQDLDTVPSCQSSINRLIDEGVALGKVFWPEIRDEFSGNIAEWQKKHLFGFGEYLEDQPIKQ